MSKVLPLFFCKLNILLEKLSFYKFNRQTISDLSQVVELIEEMNQKTFQVLGLQMQFYLFECTYQEVDGSSTLQQRRRSFPLNSELLFDKLTIKNVIRFVQTKLFTKTSEIKFGLHIKNIKKIEKMSLKERMEQAMRGCLSRLDNEKSQESAIQKIKLQQRLKEETGVDEELEEILLPESKNQQEEICIFGQKTQFVTIQNKRVRAFDVSSESQDALITALAKDQRQCCKDWPVRFQSILYSFWLLCFKASGISRTQCGNRFTSLLFSVFLVIEFILVALFMMHIAQPDNHKWFEYGIPFLFILPGVTILAPLWALSAILFGSTEMLLSYSTMNCVSVVLNYPLTLAYLIYLQEQHFWIVVICLLWLNKIPLSSFNSRTRFYMRYPDTQTLDFMLQKELVEAEAGIYSKLAQKVAKNETARKIAQKQVEKIKEKIGRVQYLNAVKQQQARVQAQDNSFCSRTEGENKIREQIQQLKGLANPKSQQNLQQIAPSNTSQSNAVVSKNEQRLVETERKTQSTVEPQFDEIEVQIAPQTEQKKTVNLNQSFDLVNQQSVDSEQIGGHLGYDDCGYEADVVTDAVANDYSMPFRKAFTFDAGYTRNQDSATYKDSQQVNSYRQEESFNNKQFEQYDDDQEEEEDDTIIGENLSDSEDARVYGIISTQKLKATQKR